MCITKISPWKIYVDRHIGQRPTSRPYPKSCLRSTSAQLVVEKWWWWGRGGCIAMTRSDDCPLQGKYNMRNAARGGHWTRMRQLHVVKFNDRYAPLRCISWWRPRCLPQIERMPTPTTSPGVAKTIDRRRASTMPVLDQFVGRPRDEKLIYAIVRHVILHTGG
jgi:hypothetical protein